MSSDNVHRLLLDDLNMRAYAVDVTRLAQDICGIHNTTPNATVALGRTLAATALLAATLKPESNQNVRLRFHGNGPLREVQAQADARGNMRGYVAVPDVDLKATPERISFSDMIGAAILSVHRDLGLREPYRSESAVIYGKLRLMWPIT
jgi:molecular chaperone Hsp33